MSGSTPVVQVTANGLVVPAFADCLAWATAKFQGIWGADVYLGNDSPDGQLVALLATAIDDVNSACVAVFNSFSPAFAQGAGLSAVVKINGIARDVPTFSTVDLLCVGQQGTDVSGGIVSDGANNWVLPGAQNSATLVIGATGQVTGTAVCQTLGAITAGIGVVSQISTIIKGWQSATNNGFAVPGNPVEDDAQLRQRQSVSTMIPSETIMDGLVGALLAVPGVTKVAPYANATNATDANGVPGNTVAMTVTGGDATAIATVIYEKKGIGPATYGTTTETVLDSRGLPNVISFFRPTTVIISVQVVLNTSGYTGYTTQIGVEIQTAIAAYINSLNDGGENGFLRATRLYIPAQLLGPYAAPASPGDASTYDVNYILLARDSNPLTSGDIPLQFYETVSCNPASNVVITIAS
jgi:uncharacterized phage protein gp47/JayE